MDRQALTDFIMTLDEFEAPAVQNEFGASYAELKLVLDRLLSKGAIRFVSGVTYQKVVREAAGATEKCIFVPRNEEEEIAVLALWESVKTGSVSPAYIQQKLNISFLEMHKAITWMKNENYVSLLNELLISKEEFIEKFGDPDEELQRRYPLYERVKKKSPFEDWVFDEDDETDRGEDDETDPDREWLKERLNSLCRDDAERSGEEDEETGDEDADVGEDVFMEIKRNIAISQCFREGLKEDTDGSFYVEGTDKESKFEISLVGDGETLKITDCGITVAKSAQSVRKIKNAIKRFPPVQMDENNEIFVETDDYEVALLALITLFSAVEAVKNLK